MDLVRHAIDDRDSRDNVSVCLVKLQKTAPEVYTEGAVAASRVPVAEPLHAANAPRAPAAKPRKTGVLDDEDLMDFLMNDDNFALPARLSKRRHQATRRQKEAEFSRQ